MRVNLFIIKKIIKNQFITKFSRLYETHLETHLWKSIGWNHLKKVVLKVKEIAHLTNR